MSSTDPTSHCGRTDTHPAHQWLLSRRPYQCPGKVGRTSDTGAWKPVPEVEDEARKTTELDKSRRYLRPVRATVISEDPDGVHLAVYEWLPMFEEWATGPGLCGESMQQGPLPEGTEVTCPRCLEWKPKYERMLAPGYRPEDDDPDILRQRLEEAREETRRVRERLRLLTDEKVAYVTGPTTDLLCEEIGRLKAEVAAARKFAGEMRNFCSPHGVATDYANRLLEAMDRAKDGVR